jgi:alpha-glucosidase
MKSTIAQSFKLILICLLLHSAAFAKEYILLSPDKKNTIKVNITKNITWSVFRNMEILILPSEMSMTLGSGKVLGKRRPYCEVQLALLTRKSRL